MTRSNEIQPDKDNRHPILGIPIERLPRHVAIIMDGNGRWAQVQGLPRLEGHRAGSKNVRGIVTEATRLGIECLTLYSFSTENWKRPLEEVKGLMALYEQYLIQERPTIMKHDVKVRHLGFEEDLPDNVVRELRETVRISQNNTGMTLCLALNYSGRSELVAAIRKMMTDAKEGRVKVEGIDEMAVSSYLDTVGLPDPDLLIRTAGEMRISNFLLWQISYAEMFVTEVFWPDFNQELLQHAIKTFAGRERRFGGIKNKCKEFLGQRS
ncbi:MAG: isoprenyl transferase [Sedimentisphaerales bacterium]|nr:isoprenyl transferase [Sedimentisphaerales bacterium]